MGFFVGISFHSSMVSMHMAFIDNVECRRVQCFNQLYGCVNDLHGNQQQPNNNPPTLDSMAVSTGPLSSEVMKSFRNGDVLPVAVEWNRNAVVDRDAVADKTLDKNMLWLCSSWPTQRRPTEYTLSLCDWIEHPMPMEQRYVVFGGYPIEILIQ